MRWLELAWTDLGQSEMQGPKSNPVIAAYFRDAGHPEIESDDVAWCAAFVGAMMQRGGHKPTGSLMARSYLNWGQRIEEPRVGAVCVLPRTGDPNSGHVGFVVAWTDTTVSLLGGNQSNRVSVQEFQRERVLAYRWPTTTTSEAGGPSSANPATSAAPPARSWWQVTLQSKTIKGQLYALLGLLVAAAEAVVQIGLDAAKTVASWQPLQDLLTTAGANVKSVGFGLVAWGVSLTVLRRFKDEGKPPPQVAT
jgi:uncharacterized protein (TIGR02594 family)